MNRAAAIERAGASRVLLLSGWMGTELPAYFYDDVAAIKGGTGLEVYGGFGYLGKESVSRLKESGMDGYFCGLVMPNRAVVKRGRAGDDFDARLRTAGYVKGCGLKLWSGFVFGVGEAPEDIAYGLRLFKELEADALYLNPLVPSPNTELEGADPPNMLAWATLLAVARLRFPGLDLFTKPEYTQWAFRAGANAFIHTPPDASSIEKYRQMVLRIFEDK